MTFGFTDPDEVTIEIDAGGFGGSDGFKFWTRVEIRRAIDSYASVAMVAPFERDREEFREAFRPFSYHGLVVKIGDGTIFTGSMIDVDPDVVPDSSSVSATGYARPAVFEDCSMPSDSYPIEFRNMRLRSIADALAAPFGFGVSVSGEQGAAFDKVALEPEQKIQAFLADLARQRGMVLSDTPQGDLWIRTSTDTGTPVAVIGGEEGFPPSTGPIQPVARVRPKFNPREYYSVIAGIAKAKRGSAGSVWIVANDKLKDVVRPFAFKLDDTEKGDLPAAVEAKYARMFGNVVSYDVGPIPTWRDPDGNLFEPNTTIKLTAPEAMIYTETEFLIRAVTLTASADEKTAQLELVLPGAFSGEAPEALPWD